MRQGTLCDPKRSPGDAGNPGNFKFIRINYKDFMRLTQDMLSPSLIGQRVRLIDLSYYHSSRHNRTGQEYTICRVIRNAFYNLYHGSHGFPGGAIRVEGHPSWEPACQRFELIEDEGIYKI